jgi:hypothetical protein
MRHRSTQPVRVLSYAIKICGESDNGSDCSTLTYVINGSRPPILAAILAISATPVFADLVSRYSVARRGNDGKSSAGIIEHRHCIPRAH